MDKRRPGKGEIQGNRTKNFINKNNSENFLK